MTAPETDRRPRVLFLCTHNSARSQMAEALLTHEAPDRFDVGSAGANPSVTIDPMTFEVLDQLGIDWRNHVPKGFDAIVGSEWDFVITVCDEAREACPVLPGHPVFAHWPIADPAQTEGFPPQRRRVFLETARILRMLSLRFLALPFADAKPATLAAMFAVTGETPAATPPTEGRVQPSRPDAPHFRG